METAIERSESATADLIRDLLDEGQKNFVMERRREHRCPLLLSVTVTPVGEPEGEFEAVTRDISSSGISILHTAPVDAPYLNLRFTESRPDAATIIIEVLRRRKVGPMWETAGKFLPAMR
jgi:PilZ domain